jgi:hypothetical protein
MWYKNYYSNSYFSSTYKKICNFENLLHIYFTYGLNYNSNIFLHNFWYKNLTKRTTLNYIEKNLSLYFRKYYYSHQTLTIEHSYFLRRKTPEFFPLKLYILRYNNWLVTSIQWFKPLKTKNIAHKTNKNLINKKQASILTRNKNNTTSKLNRTNILFFFLKKHLKISKINYQF